MDLVERLKNEFRDKHGMLSGQCNDIPAIKEAVEYIDAKKNGNQFYGWFDDASQATPTYDPPHDAPCPYCGKPITAQDVRTHSLMYQAQSYAKRSYFYRTHRICDEESEVGMDDFILDMIGRNRD